MLEHSFPESFSAWCGWRALQVWRSRGRETRELAPLTTCVSPCSADQALDRFAMKRFYEDKIVPIGQPSQRRWVSRARCQCIYTCVCVCVYARACTVFGTSLRHLHRVEQLCLGEVLSVLIQVPARSAVSAGTWVSRQAAVCAHRWAWPLAPEASSG